MECHAAIHLRRRRPWHEGRREARLFDAGGTSARSEGDRPAEQATTSQVLRVGDRGTTEAREVLPRQLRDMGTCLLYTSDAADDM
eukprot:8995891-Alexandrium_andersonii.AAC.1